MFGTGRLLFAAGLAFNAAALPATDPNDDDFECYSSLSAYESSSSAYEEPYTTVLVSTTVVLGETADVDVPLTTLCDGRERALEPYRTYTVTGYSTLPSPTPTALYSTYTEASPTCTVAETACTALSSAYPDTYAYCEIDPPYVPCTSATPGNCFIYAAAFPKLFYWPVNTISGDFCAQNGSTSHAAPKNPPEPNTATVDGIDFVFTSPTNYVSLGYVRAIIHGERRSRTQCGPPIKTNVILPITESFNSVAFRASETYSFNFADLNTVPVEAWSRQRRCGFEHDQCVGVIGHPKEYTPIVPLPTEVLNLEPEEWKAAGCTGSADGYYITPIALATPAPTVANGTFGRRG